MICLWCCDCTVCFGIGFGVKLGLWLCSVALQFLVEVVYFGFSCVDCYCVC